MNNELKVLFLGDIVGRLGRNAVKNFFNENQAACGGAGKKHDYDFVIANVENASHGFGLTRRNHDEFLEWDINCLTSGNHIWDKKDIFEYIEESNALIRPMNYHKSVPGVGYREFKVDKTKIVVLNLLGRTFMNAVDCPFVALENFIADHGNKWAKNKIIILDFHAEATAEKACMAKFASELGVSAVLGTHTHVQTADETIIDNKCAFITDVGFCGGLDGVIGMDYEVSLKRLITSIPERFDVVKSNSSQINAVELIFDSKAALPKKISRLFIKYEEQKGED